jgi:hypothetical protein
MSRKFKEDEVVRVLSKNPDVISVNSNNKTIKVNLGADPKMPCKHTLGNGSWGKLDFLINFCNYTILEQKNEL